MSLPQMSAARWVGVLGLGWFVLFVIGGPALQGRPPAGDASLSALREFYADHGTRYLVGDYLAGLAFELLLVPFAVFLPTAARTVAHQGWARLTTSGAIGLAVTGGTATSFLDAVALTGGDARLDDSSLVLLLNADLAGIALIGLPTAVFAGAAAALLWRSVVPRGIAALGWAAAALLVVGAAFPIAPNGPLWTVRALSFVVFAGFVVATSISLLAAAPARTGTPQRAERVDGAGGTPGPAAPVGSAP